MIRIFKNRAAAPQPLGPLEVTVMEILWAHGETNVRDVVDRLERPLAYTTVMTTLDRLYKKGLLAPRKSERAFDYTPAVTGVLVVAGICVPSYLWLEPEFSREEISFTCLAAALLGGLLWVLSVARGMRGMLRAMRHTRACRRLGRPSGLMGSRVPVWVLET